MREFMLDILAVTVLMIIVPATCIVLLFSGIALLYASPFVILGLATWISIRSNRKTKKKIRMGKVKPLRMPKWFATIFKPIIKIFVGILVMLIYLWIMINIPFGLACLITVCFIGYGVGVQLGKKGK